MRYCHPMRFRLLVPSLLLMASVANADLASPTQRGQSNMRQASPRVTPPFVSPQAPPPFVPTPQTQTRTPFDATSRTYAPRYDGRSRRRYGPPYYSSASGIGELVTGAEGAAVPDEIAPQEFAGPQRLT